MLFSSIKYLLNHAQVIDNEMYKLSVQLFKQSCKTPEKQELTELTFKPDPIKQEVTCS
jgi:hypothetical protein